MATLASTHAGPPESAGTWYRSTAETEWSTAGVLIFISLLNAVVGLRQEGKAQSAMNALKAMVKETLWEIGKLIVRRREAGGPREATARATGRPAPTG